MKRVKSFSISRAKKDMLLAFLLVVITRANGDEKITALCPQQLQALIRAYQVYEELAQRHRINLLTEDVQEADKERDVAFNILRNIIKNLTNSTDPAKQKAAKLLWKVTKEIGYVHRHQYDVQTGALTTYCNDLLGNHLEEVELLELTVAVQNLKAANENFIKTLAERTETVMGFEKGESEEARRKAVVAYRNFILLVDAEALKNNADVEPFVEFLNAEIDRLRIALGQSVSGSTGTDEEGEETVKFKNATFKFFGGNSMTFRVEVGAPLVAPANTEGLTWKPKVPEVMPATNKTFREVPIEAEGEQQPGEGTEQQPGETEQKPGEGEQQPTLYKITYMHKGQVYAVQEYEVGAKITTIDPPEGYYWRETTPGIMPAHDITITSTDDPYGIL